MDRHPSNYNTVRILAPVMPFYDHGATLVTHHRHLASAGGPGPGPGPGGGPPGMFAQPILVSAHSTTYHPTYQLYRAYRTMNPTKLAKSAVIYQQRQQMVTETRPCQQQTSSMNTWFTWKRKNKNSNTVGPNSINDTHHQHVSEYCPAANLSASQTSSSVPPSLARLFVQPNHSAASVKNNVNNNTTKSICICKGLTESTFMAPTYFNDDDQMQQELCDQRKKPLDDNNFKLFKCKSKSKTLRPISQSTPVIDSRDTLRSISTDSLLFEESSSFKDKNLCKSQITKQINEAKSFEQLTNSSTQESNIARNRKSILECNVNPYELVESLNKKRATKESKKCKVKSATVAAKSSRRSHNHVRSNRIEYDSIECLLASGDQVHHNNYGRSPLYKGIFNPAKSIRIAGQSVYSSISFGADELMIEERQITAIQSSKFKSVIDINHQQHHQQLNNQSSTELQRYKSTDWNFDSTEPSNSKIQLLNVASVLTDSTNNSSLKLSNFHSVLIEPEPDYDIDEDEKVTITDSKQISKSTDSISTQSDYKQQFSSHTCHNFKFVHSYNRRNRSNSVTRPKVNPPPPPPPSSLEVSTIIPKPPPPPPPNFFVNVNTAISSDTNASPMSTGSFSLSSQNQSPKLSNSVNSLPGKTDSLSFQNELKEKLNQGVKSILKKTVTLGVSRSLSNIDSDSSTTDIGDSLESTDSCGSVENHIQAFESSSGSDSGGSSTLFSKPKKHVHFRVKSRNGHLSRSRSTSHIITETIEEEEDEHYFYDDVAIPLGQSHNLTRSFDDISIISISSCSSVTNSTPCQTQSHSPPLDKEMKLKHWHHGSYRSNVVNSNSPATSTNIKPGQCHKTPLIVFDIFFFDRF